MIKRLGKWDKSMFRLAKYLKKYKKQAIIGPVFKLLEAIFELIVPLVMARIIDQGISNRDTSYVLKMGGLMIALGIFGYCFALICQYVASVASQGFGTILRRELFSHINKLSYKELDTIGSNSLITRITNDVNQMQVAVAMLIRLVVRAPFLAVGSAVMAMMLDLKLSIIFLAVVPFVVAVIYLVMSRSIPFYKKRQSKLDNVSLVTKENLEGARVIRAFSKEEKERARFAQASEEVTEIAEKVGKISAMLSPATFAILNIAIIAILWFGGYQVESGVLSQGQIIAFISYMTQISLALVVVAHLVILFTKAGASAARINEVLDMTPTIIEGTKEIENGASEFQIILENVCFSYTGTERYALEDISLQVKRGETIGIIGGTGSGKTTLVNLLPRFYEATKGSILYEGIDVKELKQQNLSSQFGIVPQKAVLFKGTIRENMQWQSEKASDEEIWEALRIAQAKEFVEQFQEGLNTKIQQGGKNLSGGQRQRLTIARALVSNPSVLILDDSASALDYATDAKLRSSIKTSFDMQTVFIISQRANSIRHADKILVLAEGCIVGCGGHEELFEQCEVYKEIVLSQLSAEEVKDR